MIAKEFQFFKMCHIYNLSVFRTTSSSKENVLNSFHIIMVYQVSKSSFHPSYLVAANIFQRPPLIFLLTNTEDLIIFK